MTTKSQVWINRPKDGYFYFKNEDKERNRKLFDDVTNILFPAHDVIFFDNYDVSSYIWVRDYFPIHVNDKLFQFHPATDFLLSEEKKELTFKKLSSIEKLLKMPVTKIDLVLDGGNIVQNHTHVIITEKVFKDNKRWNKNEIVRALASIFDGKKVVIIKDDEYDITGHADGYCTFINKTMLLVNDYSKVDKELHDHNIRILDKENIAFDVLPMYVTEKKFGKWYSLEGNYINMLVTNTDILLSTYGNKPIEERVEQIITTYSNHKLHWIDTSPIHKYGGGLHCITWEKL